MHATRRSLLQLPLLAALAGCTTSPVVQGSPGPAAEPIAPTRTSQAAAAADWVAGFAALIGDATLTAASWGATPQHLAWLDAVAKQSSAHGSRVESEDPVTGGTVDFPPASPTPAQPATAATPADVVALLTARVAEGSPVLQAAIATAGSGAERLLYASIATASAASLRPDLPPAEGGAEPAPFADPDVSASLALALGHVLALVRALEVGLGRLSRKDPLLDAGTLRLDGARALRNQLLAAITGDAPEGGTWELPNAMSTPAEIRSAWSALEANVLDAIGVVVAADTTSAATWLTAMLAQVQWVHQWGGRLPNWPGWVAR
ncbi:hypothetical protein [Tessaracoccus antarcticus]|uniref:DUF4439 domain-containing protein n=1 Tax=Tessaracoccus antarcticus TaxID=2479848 RepID=A0A3M0GR73_9ACTN|nr:hypothetical protein [Tessaracoccus antarcticus]RMB59776.1 hypothetical protein EAX62_08490 [Tessaracoccus antarcticus]